jgi:hypothetical protein
VPGARRIGEVRGERLAAALTSTPALAILALVALAALVLVLV